MVLWTIRDTASDDLCARGVFDGHAGEHDAYYPQLSSRHWESSECIGFQCGAAFELRHENLLAECIP